jgi:crotonobetainyl-CoA:carnitine CoA-transferase CaiB-like acyl-CoA transferase
VRQALADLVVVELAQDVPGEYAGKVFADLGADVVKVEPPEGDPLRADRPGSTGHFLHLNTNKRSVVLERDVEVDRHRLHQLLATADLVLTGGVGRLDDWGLDWVSVHARWPVLVVGSITGFGLEGPYAEYPYADITLQAMAGVVMNQGQVDQAPLKLPAQATSHLVGSACATAALAAVLLARDSGEGSLADISALEVLAATPARSSTHLGFRYRGETKLEMPATGESLIPAGVFPCADGYVSIYTTPQRIDRMLATLDSQELRAWFAVPTVMANGETREVVDGVLYPWLLEHTADEIAAAGQAHGWSVTPMQEPRAVLAAEHLHQRGFWSRVPGGKGDLVSLPGAPFRFDEGGWSLRAPAPATGEHTAELLARPPARAVGAVERRGRRLPLEGIRIIDMTTVWAGPGATMLLADLGAEVIRVENPWVFPASTKGMEPRPALAAGGILGVLQAGYGKPAGDHPDRPYNRHSMNNAVSRNKLSCTIDVRRPEGREILMRLIEKSDVFIENFKSGSLPSMGLHPSEMLLRNPRLVVMRLPPTGSSGDWAGWMGFGPQFDALTGFLWMCGHPGSDPTTSPAATTYMDSATGPATAFATMAALHYRDATGRGQEVEVGQIDNTIQHLGDVLVDLQLTGEDPDRIGNRHPALAPQGIYACADGWLALSIASDEEWRALADAMGRTDLATDERLASVEGRQADHDDIDDLVTAWTSSITVADGWGVLRKAAIAAAPLMDDAMLAADPQLAARRWFRPATSRDVGTFLHAGSIFHGVPHRWDSGAPVLGEHNDYVYRDILGIGDGELEALRGDGILAEDYVDTAGRPY